MAPDVAVVRQDLGPMIRDGVVQVNASQGRSLCGCPDEGSWGVNASAVAELAHGSSVHGHG